MKNWTRPIMMVVLAISIGGTGAMLQVGCAGAHRTPNADGSPTAPVTTTEQVNFDNAQIAIHNRAIAEGLISVKQAGFLETEYFDKLSAAQIKITRIHQQLTPLLKNPVAANSAQINDLLGQIKTIAAGMVTDGSAGIKNDQSKQSILTEVNAISSLVSSIVSTLTTAGIIKI
jgi:hypothetical protein